MIFRSLLFAPGDAPRKMEKALASEADAVILDLEDAVETANKPLARKAIAEFLRGRGDKAKPALVRINPLDTEDALQDLAAVVSARPDAIMLPKSRGAADVVLLDHYLDALEVQAGRPRGTIKILPLATETAGSLFTLGSYQDASSRLIGLSWGAEDLATALGAATNRDEKGALGFTYQLARSLCLAGARAAGIAPIETVYTDYRDLQGLAAHARARQREGFSGMLAIHPDQVVSINTAFSPAAADVAHAKRVVAAFAAGAGKGAIGIDGKMLDIVHLKQAKAVLELAARLRTQHTE